MMPPMLPGSDNWGRTKDPVTYNMGMQIFKIRFNATDCLTSDGKYMIACGLNMDTIYKTDTDVVSEIDERISDYSRDENTEISGSVGGSFMKFSAKGSYSRSYETVNKISSDEKKTYITTQIKMELYKIYTGQTAMEISDEFKKYIDIMVNTKKNGETDRYLYWIYKFTEDFSLTYISEITVGGALIQNVFVDDTFCMTTNKDILSRMASASASFMGFGASGSDKYGLTQEQINTFKKYVSHETTSAVGGIYYLNSSLAEWQKSVVENPSVLEYVLSDTVDFLVPELLSDYPAEIILQIRKDYINIQNEYLEDNTHKGCSSRNATNYKVWANCDDNQCIYNNKTGSNFGGYYLKNLDINPYTGDESCPAYTTSSCTGDINTWPFFGNKGTKVCICLTPKSTDTDLPSFGGAYGATVNNITNANSCPDGYEAKHAPGGGMLCVDTKGNELPGYFMGGGYVIHAGVCALGNLFMSDKSCNCPSWANMQTIIADNGFNRLQTQLVLCYGNLQYTGPTDQGMMIPYKSIAEQNGTNMTSEMSTTMMMTSTSMMKSGNINISFNLYEIILLIMLVVAMCLAIVLGYIALRSKAKRLAEYERV